MKRILFAALCALAAARAFAAPDFTAMLRKVDSLVSFTDTDFSGEYTINHISSGAGKDSTVAAIFRRDKDQKFLILILEPRSDRGKGYLKIDDNFWLYDPISRAFSFTSTKERFQNSNARNSDFTQSSFATDYEITRTTREKLGKFDCWVLDLKASNDSVTFAITKLWISDDNLVRKKEDYSLSGQILRTTAIPAYQQVGEHFVPITMVILDNLQGRTVNGSFVNDRTTITIAKPSLERLPDALFSKAYLEKFAK
ncbi:MAG: outer membrane lipoprotein-sorting protein [Rectinemataceae bacterium]|jgi:outer membrane lipoprotein-sorting protein